MAGLRESLDPTKPDRCPEPALSPGLARFPKFRLGFFPTPLQEMAALGRKMGHGKLYVKRDDLTGLSLGGNKTRSLQYLIGDALYKSADTVITSGGLQSNLCSLTAAACAKAGLRCILVHNDDPPSDLRGNMLLSHMFGARTVYLGKVSEEARSQAVEEIADGLSRLGNRPYVIRNGASTPLGALGYVDAAFELHRQDPSLRHVAIVGAMGGTASGFVFGACLLSGPFRVHVISVEYPAGELRRRMNALIEGLKDLTGLHLPTSPENIMTIYDEYLGEGYGIPTPESLSLSRDLPSLEGIFLDSVYNAKTFAGSLDLIRRGVIPTEEPACFIHTGGMATLFT